MLGNTSLKSLIIAYHAVPGMVYDAAQLSEMGMSGQGNFLDTSLNRLLEQGEIVDAAGSGGKGHSHAIVYTHTHVHESLNSFPVTPLLYVSFASNRYTYQSSMPSLIDHLPHKEPG